MLFIIKIKIILDRLINKNIDKLIHRVINVLGQTHRSRRKINKWGCFRRSSKTKQNRFLLI